MPSTSAPAWRSVTWWGSSQHSGARAELAGAAERHRGGDARALGIERVARARARRGSSGARRRACARGGGSAPSPRPPPRSAPSAPSSRVVGDALVLEDADDDRVGAGLRRRLGGGLDLHGAAEAIVRGMPRTVILGAARTPVGAPGRRARLPPGDGAGRRSPSAPRSSAPQVAPEQVEHVVMGQVLQAGAGQIPSRQAQIAAGIPKEVPSETVNKVCASGPARGGPDRRRGARRRPRRRRGRRDGVHVAGALPAAAGPLRRPHGRRDGARRHGQGRADEPVQRQADVPGGRRRSATSSS